MNSMMIYKLTDKFFKENKSIFLLDDFNINLLNYDIHPPTNDFLDSHSSHCFFSDELQSSRVVSNSKTLMDNIFYNFCSLPASMSDHFPQFLVASNIFFYSSYPKPNKYIRE